MNIQGGPEELATFIRTLNDEPIYFVQEQPKIQPVRRAVSAPSNSNLSTSWLAIGVIAACFLALLKAGVL